jgi:hypothetical protein
MTEDTGELFQNMKYWFEISVMLAAIIAGLVIGWIKIRKPVSDFLTDLWKGEKKPKKSPDFSVDKNINEFLNRLRYDTDACRVKVLQYHNGGFFSNGKSMKKMSMTHESCHPGMKPTLPGSNDIMVSLFADLLEMAHENEPNLINTGTLKDSFFKSYLQSNHVLMFSVLPLRSTKREEIGCILCEWCAWEFADRVQNDRFYDKFSEARNSIEFVLSTERKK